MHLFQISRIRILDIQKKFNPKLDIRNNHFGIIILDVNNKYFGYPELRTTIRVTKIFTSDILKIMLDIQKKALT